MTLLETIRNEWLNVFQENQTIEDIAFGKYQRSCIVAYALISL